MSQAWFGIGVTFEEEDRWYEAIHYIKKAIELDDQNGEYWLGLGDCEYRLNNYEEAEECYRKVIDFDPENEDGWISYSELLAELNRPFEASEIINTALFYHHDNQELRYRQVVYLYQAGYQQDAYVRFAETMEKYPTGFAIIFELLPSLEFDTHIGDIIRNNR